MAEPVAKRINFGGKSSLWLWLDYDEDHITVVFLDAAEPNVWHVGLDVFDGEESSGMRIVFDGQHADLALDGVSEGTDRVVEWRAEAQPLKDFAVDIQVARSSRAFQDELRGLIDG